MGWSHCPTAAPSAWEVLAWATVAAEEATAPLVARLDVLQQRLVALTVADSEPTRGDLVELLAAVSGLPAATKPGVHGVLPT